MSNQQHQQQYQIKNLKALKVFVFKFSKIFTPPLIIALSGELGSGKTQFAKFFGEAIGITKPILSPTFIKLLRYKTSSGWMSHLDAYHFSNSQSLSFFLEYLDDEYVLIEWPELFMPFLNDKKVISINISNPCKNDSRELTLKSSYKIIKNIRQKFN